MTGILVLHCELLLSADVRAADNYLVVKLRQMGRREEGGE